MRAVMGWATDRLMDHRGLTKAMHNVCAIYWILPLHTTHTLTAQPLK